MPPIAFPNRLFSPFHYSKNQVIVLILYCLSEKQLCANMNKTNLLWLNLDYNQFEYVAR